MLAALFCINGSQCLTCIQRSLSIQSCQTCGQLDARHLSHVKECAVLDLQRLGAAFDEVDLLECIAVEERLLSNVSNVLTDVQNFQVVSILECLVQDGINAIGNGVLTALASGEVLEVGRAQVVTDQSTLMRGVEYLVVTLNHTNVDLFQSLTAGKCTGAYQRYRVRNGYGLDVLAVLEGVLQNGRNLNTLIGLRNDHVVNLLNVGTLLNRIGTIGLHHILQRTDLEEGVYRRIAGHVVVLYALAGCVSNLVTRSTGAGEPTQEGTLLAGGNGQRELLIEGDLGLIAMNDALDALFNVKYDLVLVCDPVCVQDQVILCTEYLVVEQLTVTGSSRGRGVPAVKGVTVSGGRRQSQQVVRSDEQLCGCRTLTNVEGDAVDHNVYADPLRGICLGSEADCDGVQTGLREDDRSLAVVSNDNRVTIVDLDLVVTVTNNGRPVNVTILIQNGVGECLVVGYQLIAVLRVGRTGSHNADANDLTRREGNVSGSQIQRRAGNGDDLGANLYVIAGSTLNGVPGNDHAIDGKACGSLQGSLLVGVHCCLGREEAGGYGRDLDGQITREVLKAVSIAVYALNHLTNLYQVVSGAVNGRPYQRIGLSVYRDLGHSIQLLLVYEGGGNGACEATSRCRNNELDTALLHFAVCEVVDVGVTIVDHLMVVGRVAALDGDEVLLCTGNGVKQKRRGVDNLKGRNLRQSLCVVVSRRGLLACGNRNNILTGNGEVEGQNGRTGVLVIDRIAIGVGDLNRIGSNAVDRSPLYAVGIHLNGGSLVVRQPQRIQRGVAVQSRTVYALCRQLLSVIEVTDPPAAKGVSFLRGNGQIKDLAAARGRSCDVRTLKGYVIFHLANCHLYKSCIERGVCRDDGGRENVRRRKRRIRVPADKYVAVLGRIGRLCHGSTVYNDSILYGTTAIGVKCNSIRYLAQESDLCAQIVHRDDVIRKRCGCRTVTFLVKYQRKSRLGDRIFTKSDYAVIIDELITVVQLEQVLAAVVGVKVVGSRFGSLRDFRHLGRRTDNDCDNNCRDQCNRYTNKGPKPFAHVFHILYLLYEKTLLNEISKGGNFICDN